MQLDEDGELTTDMLYSVPHLGTVADRNDPEKLGRVRLLVPGIYQVPSPWAWPLGTLGGGSAQRGAWFVPEKGADVMVFFALGSHERPHFLAAHFGKPGGVSEAPTPIGSATVEDAPDIRVIETKNWLVILDDRDGEEQLVLKDKNNASGLVRLAGGNVYFADSSASQPFVKGTAWKSIEHAVIQAIATHVHSSAVGPTSPPLNAALFTAQDLQVDAAVSTKVFGE